MSIRTSSDLIRKVDEQLIWRRKELTELKGLIEISGKNHTRQQMLIRAGIALLYAHWEGFVKRTGTYLLDFVSMQRHTSAELTTNFVSVVFKKRLNEASKSKKFSVVGDIVDFFYTKMNARTRIVTDDVIETNSNLSTTVLLEILWILGIDERPFLTKMIIIDERLVQKRNFVAHGEVLSMSVDDYLALHEEVLALLELFRNQIENACVEKTYLRNLQSP